MLAKTIYEDGTYWKTHDTFHEEDAGHKSCHAIRFLGNIHPGSILDIGCGSGKILRLLCGHYGCKGTGYDISEGAIARAQQWKTPDIEYVSGDIERINESFDLATMFDVFEHVDDYIGFLRCAHGKAKQYLFIIPIDFNVISALLDRHMLWREYYGHLHSFSRRSALATLNYAGYRVIKWEIIDESWYHLKKNFTVLGFVSILLRLSINAFSKDLKMKLLGGSSLYVLAE